MSFLDDFMTHLGTLLSGDASLSAYCAIPRLYMHLPPKLGSGYPCLSIDGLYRSEESKQVSYMLNINLWTDSSAYAPTDITAFYGKADELLDLLNTSTAITCDSWVAKPEPESSKLRCQFICTVYQAGL